MGTLTASPFFYHYFRPSLALVHFLCRIVKNMIAKINEAVASIQRTYPIMPTVGIVLGSGLGSFTGEMTIEKEIPYSDIPHFPVSTVEGHSGELIFGKLGGKNVVAMAGRFD
jgi:purine-nucleoside phosphorylase